MGKAKKRNFNKGTIDKGSVLKRNDIVTQIISDIKNKKLTTETKHMISLFGISIEELSEAGIAFEELSAVKHLLY